MVDYEGTVIRPPSEADSLILQVTLGCSDNRCSFCPAYKDKRFRIKDLAAVEREMRAAAAVFPGTRKLFLADGDALIVPAGEMRALLELANGIFPRLQRVGVYGSVKSLERLTVDELAAFKRRKLGIVYLGFETGDDEVYRRTGKYGSPDGNLRACRALQAAGIKTNVTVILGLGGKERSRAHAEGTARLLSAARPDQIAALTLMVVPGTPLYAQQQAGMFTPLNEFEFLRELRIMVAGIDGFPCLFFSNHASNYYPVRARFPRDRAAVLAELDNLLSRCDRHALTPEHLRGL